MTKEQERDEIHRTIWQIANDLHGSVDGWNFKSYILGMLFYRFVSEYLIKYINQEEQKTGNTLFNYAELSNIDAEISFDAIVSNPPYAIKWDSNSNPQLINDPRFSPAGILAPKSKAHLEGSSR